MPRTIEQMLGNEDIEIVPVNEKYIVTWKEFDSEEKRGEIFESPKAAERFAMTLDPTRAIGIMRLRLKRGQPLSYDEIRNARRATKELERELRTDPTMMDKIRAAKALLELDLALRDAERTEPN